MCVCVYVCVCVCVCVCVRVFVYNKGRSTGLYLLSRWRTWVEKDSENNLQSRSETKDWRGRRFKIQRILEKENLFL